MYIRSKKYKYIIIEISYKIINKLNNRIEKEHIKYLSDNFKDQKCRKELYDIINKNIKHKNYENE